MPKKKINNHFTYCSKFILCKSQILFYFLKEILIFFSYTPNNETFPSNLLNFILIEKKNVIYCIFFGQKFRESYYLNFGEISKILKEIYRKEREENKYRNVLFKLLIQAYNKRI